MWDDPDVSNRYELVLVAEAEVIPAAEAEEPQEEQEK